MPMRIAQGKIQGERRSEIAAPSGFAGETNPAIQDGCLAMPVH
jgi:hypothetical protein